MGNPGRYDPDSHFPPHAHPDGEEILVLDGVFSDEHGDYPASSLWLNPEGFSHAPFSKEGCILFVKLRQYPGQDRRHVAIDTGKAAWQAGSAAVSVLPLYAEAPYPETIRLLRLTAGSALPEQDYPSGAEIFVLEGDLSDGNGDYEAGSWARIHRPANSTCAQAQARRSISRADIWQAEFLQPSTVARKSSYGPSSA